ncbi:MAG: aldehyde ferredoxin oxidoreductase [Thermoanaerobacteraceae bacterium]|nr:aldehyde ferredoxin oxidoreductase [Thermoanaerobacteraceae bacterium]
MKIYRVNMTEGKVTSEDVPEKYAALGGRGLTSQIVTDEVDPICHPLGPKNKLVIAPGLLSGTNAPSSGRLSVGFKSPLTGGIKETNVGGTAAQKLARLGIKAIIIEGQPQDDKFYMLKVSKDGIKLLDADSIAGKKNYDINKTLRKEYGNNIGVMSIGPAGEYRLSAASIAVADTEGRPVRHAGRGGGGAVMGSKGIKAIIIDDADAPGVSIHDKEQFREAARDFAKILTEHPVSGKGLPMYGTAVLVNVINEAGGLPTKNFRHGRFEFADKISGEMIHDTIKERKGLPTHGCHAGCVIRCSQVYHDKEGNYLTAGFEYETIWAFGANCMIDDIDAIAKLDFLCDDIGVDTIEMGVTVGVAMEAGVIDFGDAGGAINLLEQIAEGTQLGRIIGNGAGFTGKAFGVTRVPTVKNQGIPAYDPRSIKGIGVTYATTPMGADHTAGYSITANVLKVGRQVDPLEKEGQVELSRDLQIATAAVDSTGLCLFVAFALLDEPKALQRVVDMLNAQYNWELTTDDITELGKSILRTERDFNTRAGFNNADDRLPEFFEEELAPHGAVFDIPHEELDQLFNF